MLRARDAVEAELPIAGLGVHNLHCLTIYDLFPDGVSSFAFEKMPVMEMDECTFIGLAFLVLPHD